MISNSKREQILAILAYLERVAHSCGHLATEIISSDKDLPEDLAAVWHSVAKVAETAGFRIVPSDFGKAASKVTCDCFRAWRDMRRRYQMAHDSGLSIIIIHGGDNYPHRPASAM